ncbi:hypothetical protein LCGC14_1345540, partial [marine sediment metagenome]
NVHHIASNATPADPTSWSTPVEIGESDSAITALVEDGDTITIDAVANSIELDVSTQELERRSQAWVAPQPRFTRGVLAKYARTVSSASTGAVTDLP